MMIHFICPNGHELSAPAERAGKPGKCPKCQTEFLVPGLDEEDAVEHEASGSSVGPRASEDMIVFLCPNGHKLNGPAKLKGRAGQCPHCHAKFRIPDDDDEEESPVAEVAEPVESETPPEDEPIPPEMGEPIDGPVEVVDEPVDEMAEIIEPPFVADHPLHAIVCWLSEQRPDGQPYSVRMKDGEVIEVDRFAPSLSLASFAVFAAKENGDRHSLLVLPWNDIARIDLHHVPSLDDRTFR